MNGQLKKKKIVTALLFLCLVLVYVMIFCFSAETAEESSALSRRVMDFLVELYYKLAGGGGEPVIIDPDAVPLEHMIRKAAHFTEYMAVGFLSFWIVALWGKSLFREVGIVTVQVAISGALDELHQYFIPGRYASLKDVLIDTIGGIAGVAVVLLVMLCKRFISGDV